MHSIESGRSSPAHENRTGCWTDQSKIHCPRKPDGMLDGPALVHMLGTGLTGGVDRSDRCELKVLQLPCFQVVCMHSSRGSCIGSGGACICAGGALCGCSSFDSVVCALCLSFVLSQMCRSVALA
jgi:hypothetical protein